MTLQLRDYQEQFVSDVTGQWAAGNLAVLGVMPTGAGKTKTAAELIRRNGEPTCVMVHRGELVAQLSEALAEAGITHRIEASKSTVAMCVARHVKKFGRSFVHHQSPVGVASVQTLVSRLDKLKQWIASLRLLVIDEAHHSIASQYVEIINNLHTSCKILGVTATPDRCDRKSLAKLQKGVFDVMVEGPTVAWLIDQGYLVSYRYYAPPPSIHMDDEDISASTGEFKAANVRKKSHESRIVGDIVQTYQRYLIGKQAIVFVVDVETAHEVAKAFNEAGIHAAAVSGKTPDSTRIALFDKFSAKSLKVLVNVDLADEGVDVPGLDATIKGRPSMSLGKIRQQQGRALRPNYAPGFDLSTREGRLAAIAASDKPFAVLIDHVEAYKIHKFPDTHNNWSLVLQEGTKRSKNRDDEIPLRSCVECFQPYEATHSSCPYCGYKPQPVSRGTPEAVDGDLVEFSPELIAQLSGEVSRVDGAPQVPYGASEIVKRSIEKRWRERQEAQQALRHAIAVWAGVWRDKGATDSESYRRFYFTFGTDVMSAQTLGATEADALRQRVDESLGIRYEAVTDLPGVAA